MSFIVESPTFIPWREKVDIASDMSSGVKGVPSFVPPFVEFRDSAMEAAEGLVQDVEVVSSLPTSKGKS